MFKMTQYAFQYFTNDCVSAWFESASAVVWRLHILLTVCILSSCQLLSHLVSNSLPARCDPFRTWDKLVGLLGKSCSEFLTFEIIQYAFWSFWVVYRSVRTVTFVGPSAHLAWQKFQCWTLCNFMPSWVALTMAEIQGQWRAKPLGSFLSMLIN